MDVSAEVNIKHDEFVFTLGDDWKQFKGDDPEQFSFESKERKTSVVLSIMAPLNIPKERLVEVAEKLAQMRQAAEREARPGSSVEFGEHWVKLKPEGDIAEVAYAAYTPTGHIFRFFGFVTQRKVISFWVSTETKDNEFSKRVFDEVFKGLKFYVP